MFETPSLSLWVTSENRQLLMSDSFGYDITTRNRYESLSLDADYPITRCVTEQEIQIDNIETIFDVYPAIAIDSHIWTTYIVSHNVVDLLSVPIMHKSVAIGGIGFFSTVKIDWGVKEINHLRWVAAAMSLWLTQDSNRIQVLTQTESDIPSALALTARQIEILLLVEAAKSNSYIANVMGFSESTVKQELQRAMRALNASNRVDLVQRARQFDLLPSSISSASSG